MIIIKSAIQNMMGIMGKCRYVFKYKEREPAMWVDGLNFKYLVQSTRVWNNKFVWKHRWHGDVPTL